MGPKLKILLPTQCSGSAACNLAIGTTANSNSCAVDEAHFDPRRVHIHQDTKPKRLFDGTQPPSNEAIDLLLEATQTRPPTTLMHKLPIELQDMILNKVSAGPIESAKVGCMLNTGSVFTWKCGDRDIEREEGRRNRTPWTPVESHIWFGNYSSGIAYK
ncbi:hypothetical protein DM02DRAFT_653291 [Periconia macrospinosa]|uniref:Uncharacterized protein n=1 Tax=Periconia macrospinosa TaxID=97972 RepID=A0A2V1DX73_9PLEO|nr:hypothetical protein DM02DRAFT_653291 [Periconia macrospinosa]